VIGLSWGFDLHELNAAHNTAWLSQLAGIIVDSQPTWEIARSAGIPQDHIVMIPWGINLSSFIPHREPASDPRLRILTLRAHEHLYSVETVINAIKILQNRGHEYELIIGNTGSLTSDLKRQVANLELQHVNFIGKVKESELPRYFNEADVYVSAARTDGTSVTLLQAMCMKVPVVVSDSPGNIALLTSTGDEPESPITNTLGTLFRTDDAQSLADALISLRSDQSLLQKKVDAAWEYVQINADWNRNIELLPPLLQER
jgi:glycosyltransferase involved in cell wall biosynthesis